VLDSILRHRANIKSLVSAPLLDRRSVLVSEQQTTNLGIRSSNLFGRANLINILLEFFGLAPTYNLLSGYTLECTTGAALCSSLEHAVRRVIRQVAATALSAHPPLATGLMTARR
jgi:hypothetical protein